MKIANSKKGRRVLKRRRAGTRNYYFYYIFLLGLMEKVHINKDVIIRLPPTPFP